MASNVYRDPVAAWRKRLVAVPPANAGNAMTVDVEDYFQVEAFAPHVPRSEWETRQCRIEQNIDRILELFEAADAKATFFTLGWFAGRYPQLVRRIVENGHELASHGMAHFRADHQTRPTFTSDVARAKKLLEDVAGVEVRGYRAASFSITRKNLWALSALEEAGYAYSSSTYPIRHDLYGMLDQPRFAFYPLEDSRFIEIPVTTVRRFGENWPSGGGGYFRLLPYWLFKRGLRAVREHENQPCMFYFHPWEIDPKQPRIRGTKLKTRFRHYLNLHRTHQRLSRLLRDFKWARVDQVYPVSDASGSP